MHCAVPDVHGMLFCHSTVGLTTAWGADWPKEGEEGREAPPDDLGSAQALVDSLLEGVEGGTGEEPCKPQYRGRLLAAVDLEWRKLQYSGDTAQHSRGAPPHENGAGPSARVEDGGAAPNEDLHLDDGATEPLAAAVLRYYKHMGHMPCCALDVRYSAHRPVACHAVPPHCGTWATRVMINQRNHVTAPAGHEGQLLLSA